MRILLLFILLAGILTSGTAQEKRSPNPKLVEKASEYFNAGNYVKAISVYERLDKHRNWTAPRGLGDCYRLLGDSEMAAFYYERAVQQADIHPTYYLRYGTALLAIENFKEARKWLLKYLEAEPGDKRIEHLVRSCEIALQPNQKPDSYIITNLGINSEFAEFGASFFNNDLLFSSSASRGFFRGKDRMSNTGYMDIYHVPISEMSNRDKVSKLSGSVNTSGFHEGPACGNQEGNRIYYTSSNVFKRKEKLSSLGEINLKIYSADWQDGSVKNIKDLAFNGNEYSCAHPSINKDETILYFASDIAGGFGGTDIYYSVWDSTSNRWGRPINAGNAVNTEMNERFPFISDENTLFFASDGHPGFGGLDIYRSEAVMTEGIPSFTEISNIDIPLNSSADDFGLITHDNGRSGYFSSNRIGGVGGDDIYEFKTR